MKKICPKKIRRGKKGVIENVSNIEGAWVERENSFNRAKELLKKKQRRGGSNHKNLPRGPEKKWIGVGEKEQTPHWKRLTIS